MGYGFRMRCWGKYACFTRPEMKVERMSYEVMTPSAARGIVEAVYWHPGLQYTIDRIIVLNPVHFMNIRRNEVKSKISCSAFLAANDPTKLFLSASNDIAQRAAAVLTDVAYVIEYHFDMTDKAAECDNYGKFCDIINRRLRDGKCYYQPYFGCREFPVNFCAADGSEKPIQETRSLGFMLYDMDYSNRDNVTPIFFKAELQNGVIDLRNCEVHK